MLTKMQLTTLYEYTKYYRLCAEKLIREAENSRSINAELRTSILQEQRRRLRELTRLEKALGTEIAVFAEGNETAHPGPTKKPHAAHSKAKPKGGTSKNSTRKKNRK